MSLTSPWLSHIRLKMLAKTQPPRFFAGGTTWGHRTPEILGDPSLQLAVAMPWVSAWAEEKGEG